MSRKKSLLKSRIMDNASFCRGLRAPPWFSEHFTLTHALYADALDQHKLESFLSAFVFYFVSTGAELLLGPRNKCVALNEDFLTKEI